MLQDTSCQNTPTVAAGSILFGRRWIENQCYQNLRPQKSPVFCRTSSVEKEIYVKINYVNAEHVDSLIDLPTNKCVEEVIQLLKGSSSHWTNEEKLLQGRFSWGRGYGAFSVSHSDVERVAAYIASQEQHHAKKSFRDEFELFVKKYGLKWHED
ncbi:MAG: transposase [bacterium]